MRTTINVTTIYEFFFYFILMHFVKADRKGAGFKPKETFPSGIGLPFNKTRWYYTVIIIINIVVCNFCGTTISLKIILPHAAYTIRVGKDWCSKSKRISRNFVLKKLVKAFLPLYHTYHTTHAITHRVLCPVKNLHDETLFLQALSNFITIIINSYQMSE